MAERSGGEASTSYSKSQEDTPGTVIYIGVKGEGIVGFMSFEDVLREDAATVVDRLAKLGINVMLLSGDRTSAAKDMAQKVRLPATSTLCSPF